VVDGTGGPAGPEVPWIQLLPRQKLTQISSSFKQRARGDFRIIAANTNAMAAEIDEKNTIVAIHYGASDLTNKLIFAQHCYEYVDSKK
jgi:hypothetical protein